MQTDAIDGISAAPSADNIMLWNAVIFGYLLGRPEDTPWEGGTFRLSVEFTEEFPNKAPMVRFLTRMFHPNSKD